MPAIKAGIFVGLGEGISRDLTLSVPVLVVFCLKT